MNNNNYKTLQIGFMNRLRNNEFSQLVSNIISIIDEEDFESGLDSQLTSLLGSLVNLNTPLKNVRNYSRKHHLTEVLSQQVLQRHEHFKYLKSSIDTAHLSSVEEQREAAKLLQEWIRVQKYHFRSPKIEIQSRLTHDLAGAVNENEDVYDALKELDLLDHFLHILSETKAIEENFRKRNDDLAALTTNVEQTKRLIYSRLRLFVRQVEVLVNQNPDENPNVLEWFAQIEQHLDYYRSKLKARVTRRRNAAESKEDWSPENPSVDFPGDDVGADTEDSNQDSDKDNPEDEIPDLDDEE